MDQLTDTECRAHLQAVVDTVFEHEYGHRMLLAVPDNTFRLLQSLYQSLGYNTRSFLELYNYTLKEHLSVFDEDETTPYPDWPYRDFHKHIHRMSTLEGGTEPALLLCITHGLAAFRIWGCYVESEGPWAEDVVEDMSARYDRAALRLASAVFAAKTKADETWDTSEYINDIHRTVDIELGKPYFEFGKPYFNNPYRKELRKQVDNEDFVRQRISTCLFPQTYRYLCSVSARTTAQMVLPKVAGHILPQELIDLICDTYCDRTFLEEAPAATCSYEAEPDIPREWSEWP